MKLPNRFWAALLSLVIVSGCGSYPEAEPPAIGSYTTWQTFGGDPANTQYSDLAQITTDNVSLLTVAWTYRPGDADVQNRSQIQCNPIVIDTLLFGSTASLRFFALHAATGREIWTFDPFGTEGDRYSLGVNRGVVYWEEGNDRRILFTAGERLFAVDALTGRPMPDFGEGGSVSLKEGLGPRAADLYVLSNTPGVVYEDLLILGTRVNEGPAPSAPGYVRAFDVRTGALRWVFHTIPRPGEYGYDTWPPDAWDRVGGVNAWTGLSLDQARGWVFIPTGSAAFDFYGGDRAGENLFANSLLVLDARTGTRIWHYQIVRHDLWDRDLPAAPNLVTIRHGDRWVDAVAQITKSGHVWVFERATGEPLFPVEVHDGPASDLDGEMAWPLQRLPAKPAPFARQSFTRADINDVTPGTRAYVEARFNRGLRTGRQFIPPSTEGTIIFPGFDGGGEWGGAAFDPSSGILYVNANEMPWILTMVDVRNRGARGERLYTINCAVCHGADRQGDPARTVPSLEGLAERLDRGAVTQRILQGKGVMPSFAHLSDGDVDAVASFVLGQLEEEAPDEDSGPRYPYAHTGYNRFVDSLGYPAVKPPWGTLNAIDLNTGEFVWKVPLGELEELSARGIPPTGTENYGGPVVTAGGLVFIGASKDEHFRAFDKRTGEELWKTRLPAGGYATPATYEIDGKQYVVIAAGGGKMGTPSGDSYIAFALP